MSPHGEQSWQKFRKMRRLDISPLSLLGFDGGESEVELGHCCLEVSLILARI